MLCDVGSAERPSRADPHWPVFLIALGGYLLYARLTAAAPAVGPEAANEQR